MGNRYKIPLQYWRYLRLISLDIWSHPINRSCSFLGISQSNNSEWTSPITSEPHLCCHVKWCAQVQQLCNTSSIWRLSLVIIQRNMICLLCCHSHFARALTSLRMGPTTILHVHHQAHYVCNSWVGAQYYLNVASMVTIIALHLLHFLCLFL